MCYITQQTDAYLRQLETQDKADAEKSEISEFYFNQLTDKQTSEQFVNALFSGEISEKVAVNAEHLIQALVQDIANSESETDIVNKFRNGIESFCDEIAKQFVDSGKDFFNLIEDNY